MTITIELFGKFYDNHSFAIINRYLALELDKDERFNLLISNVDNYDPKYKVPVETLEKLEEIKSRRKDSTPPPDVLIMHSYPPVWRWPVGEKTKIIYYQHWEYPKIPMEWQYKWEQYADNVCCSSTWTQENILNAGMNPQKIHIVRPGVNTDIFNTNKTKSKHLNTDKFVYTFVGCGQFRKGLDIVLESWTKSFAKADKTVLFIKDNPFVYGQSTLLDEIIALQYKHSTAEIIYCDEMLSEEEMAAIYQNTNVILHPYRGEGFGMHIQEAMACGAYPVVTGGGALNDIVNPDCGLLVASSAKMVNLTDPAIFAIKPGDSLTNMGDHGWVLEPNKDDFTNKMRSLYFQHNIQNMTEAAKKAQITTWAETAKQLSEVIERTHNDAEDKPKRLRQ